MKLIILLSLFTLDVFANFTNESELSVVAARGNSSFETYSASTLSKFDYTKFNVVFGGNYTMSNIGDNKAEIARNWRGFTKVGKYLNPKFDVFGRVIVEGDEFAGYESRINCDVGFTYIKLKKENSLLEYQLSYRYTVEDTTGNEVFNDSKVFSKINYKNILNKNVNYQVWLEYIPNLTRTKDYLVNMAASIASKMSQRFSLKVEVQQNFDNEPAIDTRKKYDTTFTTSLLANF